MIDCQYRSKIDNTPVCQIVADFTQLPLSQCTVNDSACDHCLQCKTAPQAPNVVIASMSVAAAQRSQDPHLMAEMVDRMQPILERRSPTFPCILRGLERRRVQCKPCQTDSLLVVMVPVFACPRHNECTLHNTGVFPRIKACSTCEERLETGYQIEARPNPPAVIEKMQRRG